MEDDEWRYIMFAGFVGALLISVVIIIGLFVLCVGDYLFDKIKSLGRRIGVIRK